jgi:hypothetical protein
MNFSFNESWRFLTRKSSSGKENFVQISNIPGGNFQITLTDNRREPHRTLYVTILSNRKKEVKQCL